MDNKYIFSINLKRLMDKKQVSRKDIADFLGISYFTVSDWVNGKKYPRMDKVELLANYFGVLKSDLIEDKSNVESVVEADPKVVALSEHEQMMLDLLRRVPEDKQKMVIDVIQSVLDAYK